MRQLRHAIRVLARQWVFTLVATLILGLCLGANVAVLSAVNALLLQPLPYPGHERLAALVRVEAGAGDGLFSESHTGATFEAVRDRTTTVVTAAYAGGSTGVNLAVGATARYVDQHRVSAGFFSVLGVNPRFGRELTAADDQPGGPRVAILSHGLWQRTFGGNPAIVGSAVLLRGEPYTVVGVMPEGFQPLVPADVWTPLRPSRTGEGGGTNYGVLARLPAGTTWAAANASLEALSRDLAREAGVEAGRASRLQVIPLLDGQTADLRRPLWLLWTAVAAVFFIGCVNIGGMLLARATARTAEMATRLALGAQPRHIVGQLLVEAIVLALAGGAAAVVIGAAMLRVLRGSGAEAFPALDVVTLDWRVLVATLGLALLASLVFGLLPAWQASRVDLRSAGAGRTLAGRRRFVPLGLLLAGQVALTVPLLVGAGLLLRTLTSLWTLDPGFNPDRVMTAQFSLQDARYAEAEPVQQLMTQTIERLSRVPGVAGAAASLSMPYERALNMPFRLTGDGAGRPFVSNMGYVTPGFFDVLQVPIRDGRVFTASDTATSTRVAIVNDAFARVHFKGQRAVGQTIWLGNRTPVSIVGVAGSVQQRRAGWGNFGPVAAVPAIYVPVSQVEARTLALVHTWFSPSWIVRAASVEADTIGAIEQTLRAIDPQLPIAAFRTIADLKRASLAQQRFLALLVGALGALALLLSALGLYGLLSNMVTERTRELGIRVALGATRTRVVRTAVAPAMIWLAGGAAAGALLTPATTRLVESFLWGIRPTDPLTLASVATGFVLVALLAALLPAIRITRVDPAITLHEG